MHLTWVNFVVCMLYLCKEGKAEWITCVNPGTELGSLYLVIKREEKATWGEVGMGRENAQDGCCCLELYFVHFTLSIPCVQEGHLRLAREGGKCTAPTAG